MSDMLETSKRVNTRSKGIKMKKECQLVYDLKLYMLIILLVEYFGFLIFGCGALIYVLCFYNMNEQIMMWTVISSVGCSTCMCSIQYIKKIYKACIYDRINVVNEKHNLKLWGNFIYFLGRPLFAIAFTIVFIFSIKAGFTTVFKIENFEGNDRFLYFCTVISGLIGFSIGKVLDYFGTISIDNIKKMKGDSLYGE